MSMSMPSASEFRQAWGAPLPGMNPARDTESFGIDGVRRRFGRDEEIFAEGDRAEYVYEVIEGVVRDYRLLSDGRRQIEGFHTAGDCFGLEFGVEHRTTAEALGHAVVRLIRRGLIADLAAKDHNTSQRLWRLTADKLRRSQEHVLMLGRRSATERVAGFLLGLAAKADDTGAIDLPMSRQDIADYLGLTIETVSRTFTQLQNSGLIAAPTCRHIELLDEDRLEDLCA